MSGSVDAHDGDSPVEGADPSDEWVDNPDGAGQVRRSFLESWEADDE